MVANAPPPHPHSHISCVPLCYLSTERVADAPPYSIPMRHVFKRLRILYLRQARSDICEGCMAPFIVQQHATKKSLEITMRLPCWDAVVRKETCWNGLGWETKERSAIPTWCFIIVADDCHFVKWVSGCVSYKMVHPTFYKQWLSKIGGHWLIL